MKLSTPSFQFCCEAKTALKNKVYLISWANTLIRKINQFQGEPRQCFTDLIRLNLGRLKKKYYVITTHTIQTLF